MFVYPKNHGWIAWFAKFPHDELFQNLTKAKGNVWIWKYSNNDAMTAWDLQDLKFGQEKRKQTWLLEEGKLCLVLATYTTNRIPPPQKKNYCTWNINKFEECHQNKQQSTKTEMVIN